MRRPLPTLALLAGLALGLAACGSSSSASDTVNTAGIPVESTTTTAAAAATTTTTGAVTGALELKVADSSLGQILVDGQGRTLYVFTNDTGSESTCTGGCAAAWPPLVGEVSAGPGVTGALGTTTRENDVEQVTLAGHPLYYYASDVSPGAVTGQGVGGTWFVVDGAGAAITTEAKSSGY